VATAEDRQPSGSGRPTPLTPAELRGRRRVLGLTQADLAAVLDLSANTVARWERGELRVGRPGWVVRRLEQLERRAPKLALDPHSPANTVPAKVSRSVSRLARVANSRPPFQVS
jgi:predicted transcriptional regulator